MKALKMLMAKIGSEVGKRPFIQEDSVLQIVSVFALCPILVEVNIQNIVEVIFNSPNDV